jgi:hypothetical protein
MGVTSENDPACSPPISMAATSPVLVKTHEPESPGLENDSPMFAKTLFSYLLPSRRMRGRRRFLLKLEKPINLSLYPVGSPSNKGFDLLHFRVPNSL